ncbi:hypothetical protein JDV02_004812 [Purpureocillium takamizusanense]|uniref:Uncharacterized protein n=1 Tax=Purpureocillium takamizusanense TaxID=2060973 RepID=A0A9Q8QD64_9HYPO|nr:uncharacterized protein JDV02_004812 [Purpureocillium takamizusanense]UNI18549.1 hypothetical protein JDV02_004812 [Purpureocillium takamizusanense]
MAPRLPPLWSRETFSDASSGEFAAQWSNPGDVFSILLLLGGDVINQALAQLAGSGLAPVTFSFGWVAYAVSSLTTAVGHNKLMPREPDYGCKVINASNGYVRENSSWVIGRIARDFDHWRDKTVTQRTAELVSDKWIDLKRYDPTANCPRQAGLVISIYEPSKLVVAGTVRLNSIYWTGMAVMLLQLVVAAIPIGMYGDWATMVVTAIGTLLSLITGLLPQWKREKWACRRHARTTYVITRGNGAQHAIVVLGNGCGLNLEDLAAGQYNAQVAANLSTRLALFGLATLWILLLITAAGIKSHTWFLLAVGGIGIVQNIHAASHHCRPENFGLHLHFVRVIGKRKVMDTLLEAERSYENLGLALLPEFFPGVLTTEDDARWQLVKEARNKAWEVARKTSRAQPQPQTSRRQSV